MNINDIDVSTTLPALSFDYEGLKAWARGITEQYDGLVVREEDIAGIKSEMAGLNKLKAKLEAARKETVRQVSEPIRDFEAKIKDVVGIFDETRAALAAQVQAFEDAAREAKRREVQVIIDAALHENGVDGLAIEIKPAWLNKTTPLKTVKAEVEGIVLAHLRELRERAELEQARQDRAVAIETACKALGAEHGFELPASQFLRLHDLQIPLGEVQAQIAAAYLGQAAARQRAAQQQLSAPRPPQPPAQPRAAATKALTLDLEYRLDDEPQVQAVIRHLESLCTNLIRIPRRDAA